MQTSLLIEMLAARQGGSGNPGVAEMMARLRGGSETMQDMLSRLTQSNPALAAVLQQLGTGAAARPAAVIDGESIEIGGGAPARDTETGDALTAELAAGVATSLPMTSDMMQEENARHLAEIEVLRERLDRCAAALGACGVCWGMDPSCRACRGRGRPGFALPDDALFDELVLPAVRILKIHRARATPVAPLQSQPGEHPVPGALTRHST
jgi:hypothetical protein